jgi:hypothetical protein
VFTACGALEPIRLSGVAHFGARVIVDEGDGGLDIQDVGHINWERVRGVGRDTGSSYVVTEISHDVLERKDPGANEYTIVATLSLIGLGPVENYLFTARAHATLNANDDLTVTYF